MCVHVQYLFVLSQTYMCVHVQYLFLLSQTYMSSCTVPVCIVTNVHVFMYSTCFPRQIWMKIEVYRQIFEKKFKYEFS